MIAYSFNFPLILTLSRLVISFTIIPVIFIYFLPLNSFGVNCLIALFFSLVSITDFFDGYLARSYNQVTDLGTLLDPIADKFLLYSTLVSLVYIHKIYFYWAILFIGREFFVMGLREVALYNKFRLSVTKIAKYKTAAQIIYMTIAIVNISYFILTILQTIALMLSLYLSFFSAYDYYRSFCKNIKIG